jgi:hypothetical protein
VNAARVRGERFSVCSDMNDPLAVDPVFSDPDLAQWLAQATGTELDVVVSELREAALRRSFVVDELLEAGLAGPVLLEAVLRLTGVSLGDARALVEAHASSRPALARAARV